MALSQAINSSIRNKINIAPGTFHGLLQFLNKAPFSWKNRISCKRLLLGCGTKASSCGWADDMFHSSLSEISLNTSSGFPSLGLTRRI